MQKTTAHMILFMYTQPQNDTPNRDWLKTPFIQDNATMATDGNALVKIPHVSDKYQKSDSIIPDMKKVLPPGRNCEVYIPLQTLIDALDKCEITDEYDMITCPECDGIKPSCPHCEFGTIPIYNGKKYYELGTQCIQIASNVFAPDLINKLILTAEIMEVEEITMTHNSPDGKSSCFKVGEIEVFLMPVKPGDMEIIKLENTLL